MALLPRRKLLVTKMCVILATLCVPAVINVLAILQRERSWDVVSDNEVKNIILFKNHSVSENRVRVHVAISNENTTDLQPATLKSNDNVRSSHQVHQEGDNEQFVETMKDNLSNPRIRISIDDTQPVNLNSKEITRKEEEGLNANEITNVDTKSKSTKLQEFTKTSSKSSNLTFLSLHQLSSREGSYMNNTDSQYSRQPELPSELPCVTIGVYCSIRKGKWHGDHFCPATNCSVRVVQSENYTKLRNVDALYIPQSSLGNVNLQKLNTVRRREQIWIFNAFESPVHTFTAGGRWTDLGFNWTLTYRTDSTFPSPYGRYNPGYPMLPANDNTNWAENKTKFAAWIGSNCRNTQWPRLSYVKKLQNFIPLDTFGACGTKICPKTLKCGEILRRYKFFFALENSGCKDYITEKFWAAPFRNNMIPVVYGPTREDYEKVAPPKSFIHVQDFKTMAELSHYLKVLDENDALFNEYFEWKKQGSIEMNLIGNYYISKKIMCPIGAKILAARREATPEKYTVDMTTWWVNSCRIGMTL